MRFFKSFDKALLSSKIMIEDYVFKCTNRNDPSDFTRSGKMGFKDTVFFMLNMVNKTLQTELTDFYKNVLKRDGSISKQAYSENRQKINPNAFIELNDRINKVIYEECDEYSLWNGYRLSAIDGTILELPNTAPLQAEFGCSKNQRSKVARARATCIFDVINKIVIKSKIDKAHTSERKMAKELILDMLKDSKMKELILFDRGYPGAELISTLIENGVYFVMRSTSKAYISLMDVNQADQLIKIKYGKKAYTVRVVRFLLDSGIEEILLTNLFDENLKLSDFKTLYFKRWGIEIKYDELKNRLEIENFTGLTKIAIEQDFYASIYLSNMIELARKDSDEIVEKDNEEKDNKYEYKTNLNTLIGSLKDNLIMMMLVESKRKRNKMYKEMMEEVSKSRIPIRPDRQNPRPERMSRSKYRKNRKRSL